MRKAGTGRSNGQRGLEIPQAAKTSEGTTASAARGYNARPWKVLRVTCGTLVYGVEYAHWFPPAIPADRLSPGPKRMPAPLLLLVTTLGSLLALLSAPGVPSGPMERAMGADQACYTIDQAHSQVMFRVRHLGLSNVIGRFSTFDAELQLDPDSLQNVTVSATIDVASIDTGNERRDNHLRSADFFDAATYPEIVFTSTGVRGVDGATLKLDGDLTMHGITQPVTLDVEYLGSATGPGGDERVAFSARGALDRMAYGLRWNNLTEAGGVVVGHEVEIVLEVEAIRKEPGGS